MVVVVEGACGGYEGMRSRSRCRDVDCSVEVGEWEGFQLVRSVLSVKSSQVKPSNKVKVAW